MWNHEAVWGAIDALAARHDLSPSGLAKKAGLDPTAFNPSKRHGQDGRPRWPSTESIAKVLAATGESLEGFVRLSRRVSGSTALSAYPLDEDTLNEDTPGAGHVVPVLGMAEAGAGGFFDDGGFPAGHGWDEIAFPGPVDESVFALKVSGDSMLPLYRNGDVVIVSCEAQARRGDRVVVRTTSGEVMAKTLLRRTAKALELGSFNAEHPARAIALKDIDWVARILWSSQ